MSRAAAPVLVGLRPILVTGGAGFIGSNLADRLAREGHHVLILDSLARPGIERNVEWLRARHRERVTMVKADIRDHGALRTVVTDAAAVFHFAAQVAVTTSFADPAEDFAVNAAGSFGLVEAVRLQKRSIPLVFASTNKVYGNLADVGLCLIEDAYLPTDPELRAQGISEGWPIDFHTPYGCSKGTADQYVLDYARSFDLPMAVLRMSCIYGPRQMGNEDQGWVAHFLIKALCGEPIRIFGDGRQVRDILYVDDAVDAYLAAWRRIPKLKGRAFNLGGGTRNAVSLLALIAFIEERLGRRLTILHDDWRQGDQRYYVSDRRRAERELGLAEPVPWHIGVARLIDWLQSERGARPARTDESRQTEAVG